MSPRFIHVVACFTILFLFKAKLHSIIGIYHILQEKVFHNVPILFLIHWLFSSPTLTKIILVFSSMFQVQKWFGEIIKSKSESEAYTLSSRFGADSKPSEVRLGVYSNVPRPDTPNFLSLVLEQAPFHAECGEESFSWWLGLHSSFPSYCFSLFLSCSLIVPNLAVVLIYILITPSMG